MKSDHMQLYNCVSTEEVFTLASDEEPQTPARCSQLCDPKNLFFFFSMNLDSQQLNSLAGVRTLKNSSDLCTAARPFVWMSVIFKEKIQKFGIH